MLCSLLCLRAVACAQLCGAPLKQPCSRATTPLDRGVQYMHKGLHRHGEPAAEENHSRTLAKQACRSASAARCVPGKARGRRAELQESGQAAAARRVSHHPWSLHLKLSIAGAASGPGERTWAECLWRGGGARAR